MDISLQKVHNGFKGGEMKNYSHRMAAGLSKDTPIDSFEGITYQLALLIAANFPTTEVEYSAILSALMVNLEGLILGFSHNDRKRASQLLAWIGAEMSRHVNPHYS
jgi:hypothetical protein